MRYFYILTLCCLFFGFATPLYAQNKTVKGTVTDAGIKDKNNAGIPSVNIVLNNVVIGTTDINGNFTISVPNNAILEFRYVGFKTQKIPVAGKTSIAVSMSADNNQLKEVTIAGYVSKTKELSTGATTKISGKDLQAAPAATITDMLQGKVAGLNIQQNTGSPGMRGSITLRGISSINVTGAGDQAFLQPTSPLFVVDGVPIDDAQNFSYGYQQAGPGISPISLIPQEDVESIEVLKDAAATSLYGSKGAYGVILITTKRGNSKIPVVRYSGKYFLSTVPPLRKVIGGRAERDLRIAQIMQSDTSKSPYNALKIINQTEFLSDSLNAYYNNSTDWQSYFYRATYNQTQNLDISGGNQAFNYKVNLGYFDQNGIQENTGFTRTNLNMNMQYMPNPRFKLFAQINSALAKNQKGSGNGLFNTGVATGGEASSLLPSPSLYAASNQVLAAISTDNDNKTVNVNSVLNLRYEIVKNLSIDSYFNYVFDTGNEDSFVPAEINNNIASNYTFNSVRNTIYNRNLLSYVYSITNANNEGVHNFNVYAFTEINSANFKADAIKNNKAISGFLRGPVINVDNYASSLGGTLNNFYQTRTVALAANFQYDYKKRYVLNASYRWDGSSTSGPDAGYTKSPSISFRWNLNNESFLKNVVNSGILNYASIRMSYGAVIQPNGTIYDVNGKYVNQTAYAGSPTIIIDPNLQPNTGLRPTKNTTLNFGADFGLFNNRLSGTFDTYYKQTDDIYREKTLPNTSGFNIIKTNETAMVNLGYEASVTGRLLPTSSKWSVNLSANGAINHNYLTALPDGARQFIYVDPSTGQSILYRLGQNSLSNFIYNTKGVYASIAEVPVDPLTGLRYRVGGTGPLNYFKAGDPRYTDLNGDYLLDEKDLIVAGNSQPTITGGLTLDVRYKSWSLTMQGSYTLDRDILNNSLSSQFQKFNNPTSLGGLVPIEQYNIWMKEGDVATYPNPYDYFRSAIVNPYRFAQTLFQEDGSYFKLNYIQLGYSLNQGFTRRFGMNRVNLGFTASNVFFITKYSGASPETVTDLGRDSSGGYPNPRTYTLSFNVEF